MRRFSIITFIAIIGLCAPVASAQSNASRQEYYDDYSQFRVGLNGGWGYRVAEISPDLSALETKIQKKLMSGIAVGADATWFFSSQMGLGMRYHNMYASGTASDGAVTLKEETVITYLAPQVSTRYLFDRHSLMIDISAGYLSFRDLKDSFVSQGARINGSTFGFGSVLGYDYALTPRVALGASFSAVIGTLKKIKLGVNGQYQEIELDKDHYESLNHITLCAGIRFTL